MKLHQKKDYMNIFSLKNILFFIFLIVISSCSKKDKDIIKPSDVPSYEISGTKFYVDATKGSDQNSGSESEPFKTLLYALNKVKGGDGIVLRNGNYGDLIYGANNGKPIPEVFNDWVTIVAQQGHKPELEHVVLGTWSDASGSNQIPWTTTGNSNLHLRIDGISILNQLEIYGSRYVDIRNCTISTQGELSELNAKGSGISVMNGQYISLSKNLIHHSGVGVAVMTRDFNMIDNEIKECTHDGIKFYGGENILIKGNKIHDLDDGLSDENPNSFHVDGIHMHSIIHQGGYMNPRWAGGANNVTFSGNLIYHVEAMGVMINQNDSGQEGWQNFTWENNIFGPVDGRLFILGSSFGGYFIFRNNTVLFAPNDKWTSIFGRSMNSKNIDNPNSQSYHFQVWGNPANFNFYNNIFAAVGSSENSGLTQDQGIVSNNIIITDPSKLPYEPITGNIQEYINSGAILGIPTSNSEAVNGGHKSLEYPAKDIWGNTRTGLPDIGAVER